MMAHKDTERVTMLPEPSLVISALKILTTARQATSSKSSDSNMVSKFHELLLANVDKLETTLQSESAFESFSVSWKSDTTVVIPPDCSPKWRFVLYCLKTLHLLQASIHESLETYSHTTSAGIKPTRAPKMSPDTLSFSEQKVVKGAVQFIVCLGICPNLQKGVGIPLELRSGFSALVNMTQERGTISEKEKNIQLFQCVKVLLSCVESPALGTLILTQHLVDILAALFQLAYLGKQQQKPSKTRAQDTKVEDAIDTNETEEVRSFENMNPASMVDFVRSKFNDFKASDAENDVCQDTDGPERRFDNGEESGGIADNIDFAFCEKSLEELLNKIYPPLLVKTLLLLQGGSKTKTPCQNAPVLQQAPKWLREECGRRLTNVLMMPKGVQSVLRGMLDAPGMGKGMTEADDWRKCDAVAKVIACCPLQTLSIEEYYRKISPQILELLHIQDKQVCRQFLRVACSTISLMASQHPGLTQKYLFQPMLNPLMMCIDINVAMGTSEYITVEEAQLTQCLEDCNKVFVCGCTDNPNLVSFLQPVIFILYKMFIFMKPGVSALKTTCQEVLVAFLKQADVQMALTCIQLMAFQQTSSENEAEFPRMHQNLEFVNGTSGGIAVSTNISESGAESSQDTNVECVVALLKDLENTSIPGEFLVFMLKELTQFILTEVEGEKTDGKQCQASVKSQDDQALLDIEERNQAKLEQFYRKLSLLNILAAVCENLGPECIRSAKHTLEFVKATLERGVQVCKRTEDAMFEVFENETLTMAIGLLTAVLTGAFELTNEDKEAMQELLPLLQEISSEHPESSVQEMATDIRIAIATHGAVWSEVSKGTHKEYEEISRKISKEKKTVKESGIKTKQKIEVITEKHLPKEKMEGIQGVRVGRNDGYSLQGSDESEKASSSEAVSDEHDEIHINDDNDQHGQNKSDSMSSSFDSQKRDNENTNGTTKKSELDLAFKELCDTLIPVRGHGLIRLTHLVQKRDPEIQKRHLAVLKIFEENLDHGDSYIYLSAVNGLAAMCDLYPSLVVPMVCKQFADFHVEQKPGDKKRSPELRMKLGEVMLKASRCLGGTIPQYRDLLFSSVLAGVRDEDAFVRASSLSNLGEISKLLKFSLGNIIHEVFECCSSTVKYDKDVEVRKAAAQALTLLLQGTGQQSFKILDSVLKDVYRLLKHVMKVEKEEGVKLHVHLALNELDDLMKEYLFPKQKLEKRIRVLDVD